MEPLFKGGLAMGGPIDRVMTLIGVSKFVLITALSDNIADT